MQQPYGGAPTTPQPVPAVAPVAPPRGGNGLSRGLSIVAVILSAVALVISFAIPGPEGPAGAAGVDGAVGATGPQGPQGPQGLTGATGPQGPTGANGTACWDLNGNGIGDVATEDLNGDTVVDVLDCAGAQGPQGDPGPGATIATGSGAGSVELQTSCTHYTGATVTITVSGQGRVVVAATVHINFDHLANEGDYVRLFLGTSSSDCTADDWRLRWDMPANAPVGIYYESFHYQKIFTVSTAGTYTYYVNADMLGGDGGTDNFVGANLLAIFYPS